jgi:pimeloyl-ACP methyl ester carboxylesterase
VDLQGHGRTADIDRPLSVEFMADDIAALIKHLKLERPDVMDYSPGGGVALQTAIRHTEVVGRLVVVSQKMASSNQIPSSLLSQAKCVAVIPKMTKAGFMVGGKHGNGIVACRISSGWSPSSVLQDRPPA